MSAFPGTFLVNYEKLPMGLAKLVGRRLGAAGGHLCSHVGKASEANIPTWDGMGRRAQQDVETKTPMTPFGCLNPAMPESSINSGLLSFMKQIILIFLHLVSVGLLSPKSPQHPLQWLILSASDCSVTLGFPSRI